jgi:Ca2+-binding RTX toxin-like protein
VDTITDFISGTDHLALDSAVFSQLSGITDLTNNFHVVGAGAQGASDFIVYDNATGALYYDADGSGAGAAVQIAEIGITTHPVLSATDIFVV